MNSAKEISLFSLEKTNPENLPKGVIVPYSIPEGYFDNIIVDVTKIFEETEDSLPVALPNNIGSAVLDLPAGYFENFSTDLLHLIQTTHPAQYIFDEIADVAPVLSTVPRQLPFEVSEGYFENQIFATQKNNATTTPVVPLKSSPRSKKLWLTLAVAASIAGVLVFSLFVLNRNENPKQRDLSFEQKNINPSIGTVSDEELIWYLNNENQMINSEVVFFEEEQNVDPKPRIQLLSDDELFQYIQDSVANPISRKGS